MGDSTKVATYSIKCHTHNYCSALICSCSVHVQHSSPNDHHMNTNTAMLPYQARLEDEVCVEVGTNDMAMLSYQARLEDEACVEVGTNDTATLSSGQAGR